MSVVIKKENYIIANSEELIGTTEYLTLQKRCHINQCCYNQVWQYFLSANTASWFYLEQADNLLIHTRIMGLSPHILTYESCHHTQFELVKATLVESMYSCFVQCVPALKPVARLMGFLSQSLHSYPSISVPK